jgi:hypothetical protein
LDHLIGVACLTCLMGVLANGQFAGELRYRVEDRSERADSVRARFTDIQLALLEKLNRANVEHLERLPLLVVPLSWHGGELSHSPFPTV